MAKERKNLHLEAQYRIKHLERIRHDRKESVQTHEVHMELMDLMKQIIVYSSNIAKTFLLKCQPDGCPALLVNFPLNFRKLFNLFSFQDKKDLKAFSHCDTRSPWFLHPSF